MQALLTFSGQGYALQHGVITLHSQGKYMVQTDAGPVQARKASSCLLVPQPGDTVMVAVHAGHASYICAVLEQANEEKISVLETNGPMELRASKVAIQAADTLELEAANMRTTALRSETLAENIHVSADTARCNVRQGNFAFGALETLADRMTQRVKRAYRRVEELEDSKIGRVRCLVKELFSLRAETTIIEAEDKVKLEADKIMLG